MFSHFSTLSERVKLSNSSDIEIHITKNKTGFSCKVFLTKTILRYFNVDCDWQ